MRLLALTLLLFTATHALAADAPDNTPLCIAARLGLAGILADLLFHGLPQPVADVGVLEQPRFAQARSADRVNLGRGPSGSSSPSKIASSARASVAASGENGSRVRSSVTASRAACRSPASRLASSNSRCSLRRASRVRTSTWT